MFSTSVPLHILQSTMKNVLLFAEEELTNSKIRNLFKELNGLGVYYQIRWIN